MIKTTAGAAIAAAALAFAAPALATPISVMNGSHDVNSYGTGNIGIDGYGGFTTTLYSDSTTGWASALAAGNPVVVEQRGDDFANVTNVQNFLTAGGRLVLLGDFGADDFINAIFGTTLNISSNSSSASWSKTGAAAGTTFGDDPTGLQWVSSTHSVTSGMLPTNSTVYYNSPTWGTQVFRTTYGAGDFFYIGHDYCCGTVTREDAYLAVLDSALKFDGGGIGGEVPLPASLPLVLAGMGGLALFRRRKT